MAEEVQATLDEMVPALKDLQDRGVFSSNEIHQIVDRRRNSEYDVRRGTNPRKADFLRYIQDEMNLEALRQLRTKKIKQEERERERKEGKKKEKDSDAFEKPVGDKHIVKLIHNLWRRTLMKYGKSDVSLYLQYAEYCKEIKAHHSLSRILAEALQLFPHQQGLWIEAASHEFFVLGSIQNARVLMQQGLRAFNHAPSGQQDLWIQLFCLEMHFVERLRARSTILQGGDTSGKNNKNQKDKSDQGENKLDDDRHTIAKLVYKNAVAAIPDSVTFRLKFWDQCRLFSDTEKLQQEIVESIRTDLCNDNAEAWMAWALFQWEQKQKGIEDGKSNNESDEEDAEDEEENQESEGATKKRSSSESKGPLNKKLKTDRADQGDGGWSVLDILRRATQELSTEEMYLKAVRMITRYIASLQEEEDEEDDEEDSDVSLGLELLESLFDEAAKTDFFSADLVMEQALFLQRMQRKEEAIQALESFARNSPTTKALKVWIHLAEISDKGPIPVLTRALQRADMNHPSYYEVLLHLFGAKLEAQDDSNLMDLFQKLVLLTPGFLPISEIEEPIFGVPHAPDACLQLIRYLKSKGDTAHARKVYRAVLFESSLGKIFAEFDEDMMVTFVEEAVTLEEDSKEKKANKRKVLVRLYEEASKLFDDTELGSKFQERVREVKLAGPRTNKDNFSLSNVTMESGGAARLLNETFKKFQVVFLRGGWSKAGKQALIDVDDLYDGLNDEDKASWCIETPGQRDGDENIDPVEFLGAGMPRTRGYCSFLVQKDEAAYRKTLERLPMRDPLSGIQWHYPSSALWFFVGRNPLNSLNLRGRPEHTDSISNDGTWHLQYSGQKTWFLRPSKQLLEHFQEHNVATNCTESTRIQIECRQGDVLCVNTRLWFHSTVIPPQPTKSISYARDFYLEEPPASNDNVEQPVEDKKGSMTNMDGLYAADNIEEGTVIFTEKDMPDCELHRNSTNPNCEVVELEDGTSALVSLRSIKAGEFFCVAESDDEEESDEEEGDLSVMSTAQCLPCPP